MNILILAPTKKQLGGVERFSAYLQSVLAQDGQSVEILALEDLTKIQKNFVAYARYVGLQQPLLGYFLGRVARKHGYDLCVTNGMLGWNLRKKTLNVQHGTFARAADRIDRHTNIVKFIVKKYVWGSFEGIAARRAARSVAVSLETKESVELYYHARNVCVIPNAVDTGHFSPKDKATSRTRLEIPHDTNVIVFNGRFEYAKGIEIFKGLIPKLEELNAYLVVADDSKDPILNHPRVLARYFTQDELADLYNSGDVFMLPSLHEGCSYALLEAMSTGLPFVASPVGLGAEFGASGIFPGCIVTEQTLPAYVAQIKHIFDLDSESRTVLTQQLRNYILATHSISAFGASYRALVRELVHSL